MDFLSFQPFSTFQPSTKTIVAISNFNIDLSNFFNYIPITPYHIILKKRGRKPKGENYNPNKNIPEGSIISIRNTREIRGINKSKKSISSSFSSQSTSSFSTNNKSIYSSSSSFSLSNPINSKKKNWFLNSISIYVALTSDKCINVKISKHGKFHMTGCKTVDQAIKVIYYLFHYIKETERIFSISILTLKSTNNVDKYYSYSFDEKIPEIIFNTVMNNIDFKLNYNVDREKVNQYLESLGDDIDEQNEERDFIPVFEEGENTGLNIKIKPLVAYDKEMERIRFYERSENKNNEEYENRIKKLLISLIKNKYLVSYVYDYFSDILLSSNSIFNYFLPDFQTHFKYDYIIDKVDYTKYIDMLPITPTNEREIWINKCAEKYHTFLVFHSGAVILSGSSMESMKINYEKFIKMMINRRHLFEEVIIND